MKKMILKKTKSMTIPKLYKEIALVFGYSARLSYDDRMVLYFAVEKLKETGEIKVKNSKVDWQED